MPRSWTEIDRLADAYVDQACALDPIVATEVGVPGHEDALPDLSPDGLAEISALRRRTLAALATATPLDPIDATTVEALRDQLEIAELLRDAGAEEADLNNIASPVQAVRDVFDLMATATDDDWAVVATRLRAVPAALAGYAESLRVAVARGDAPPARQVHAAIAQSRANTGDGGFFASFTAGAETGGPGTAAGELPASLRADLRQAGEAAAAGYADLMQVLHDELLPVAPTTDGVGRERYPLYLRSFLGTVVDIEETYDWGLGECARLREQMTAIAGRIKPGAGVVEAMAALDDEAGRQLTGTGALQAWMQQTSDAALQSLRGVHFEIPDALMALECRIAPTQNGGIYYTGPSDDFSRPGRMWWSVPPGVERFGTWRELTTVFHEGVPGHHLQVGQAVHNRDQLNSWRRLMAGTSGHSEGWALYAERLMGDLGYLDDDGDRLGMLDGQSMRAARVVIDIGVHCDLPAPAEVGGGRWTYEKAWDFFAAYAQLEPAARRFELDRYLGWPGQAPAYKIGERFWRQLRDDVAARDGAAFDLRDFHGRALDLGGLGLDALRTAVVG